MDYINVLFTFILATMYFMVVYLTNITTDSKLLKLYQLFGSTTHGILVSICSYIDICIMVFYGNNLEDSSFLYNWHYFSLFYFIYDIYWCIYLKTSLYIYHHIACIICLVYALLINKYTNLLSVVLFCGEVTAPLINIISLLKIYEQKNELLFICFATSFVLMRFIITPIVIIYIYAHISSYDKYIFIIMGLSLLGGSIIWAKGQYNYIKKKICYKLD